MGQKTTGVPRAEAAMLSLLLRRLELAEGCSLLLAARQGHCAPSSGPLPHLQSQHSLCTLSLALPVCTSPLTL